MENPNVNSFNSFSDCECNGSARYISRYHPPFSLVSQITTGSDSIREICKLAAMKIKKAPCFLASAVMLSTVFGSFIGGVDAQVFREGSIGMLLSLSICKLLILESTFDNIKLNHPSLVKLRELPIVDVGSHLKSLLGKSYIENEERISGSVVNEMLKFESYYEEMLLNILRLEHKDQKIISSYIPNITIAVNDNMVTFCGCPRLSKFFVSKHHKSILNHLTDIFPTQVTACGDLVVSPTSYLSRDTVAIIFVVGFLIFALIFYLLMCFRFRGCNFKKNMSLKSIEKDSDRRVDLGLVDFYSSGDPLSLQIGDDSQDEEVDLEVLEVT
ncbi:putative membrane protein [Candidatus Ichthyocystis hellenicum]|uniref:Putative membrane protein n=1 Tax=Candidatus Ichthyocystis hellenicum TaxID=1561003 RepID=A0A0S4M9S0_9BURK|nr:hypothetical protein [Candidatus Ichthyocystis hellenicum]CUT18228.1 putative membrane protein [Candidatus Ichthyocystis hellenicum]